MNSVAPVSYPMVKPEPEIYPAVMNPGQPPFQPAHQVYQPQAYQPVTQGYQPVSSPGYVSVQPQPQHQMQVQIPPGYGPGSMMQVQTHEGAVLNVAVPQGMQSGQIFLVNY